MLSFKDNAYNSLTSFCLGLIFFKETEVSTLTHIESYFNEHNYHTRHRNSALILPAAI